VTDGADANAAIWKSEAIAATWAASAAERERARGAHWQILASLLPFDPDDEFVVVDLGAGTGAATAPILTAFPRATAVLADFSPQMVAGGTTALEGFVGRFRYVEFDLLKPPWPATIPDAVDAVVTSLCVHHLPDARKRSLFVEIFERLKPGGWYFNYDPVTSSDPTIEAIWRHTADRADPQAEWKRAHLTPDEQARHENHVRYMIPLEPQVGYLRDAGFDAVDVYWKHLENVIYGGRRPG
jgi:SAM-dependent methyltransferase